MRTLTITHILGRDRRLDLGAGPGRRRPARAALAGALVALVLGFALLSGCGRGPVQTQDLDFTAPTATGRATGESSSTGQSSSGRMAYPEATHGQADAPEAVALGSDLTVLTGPRPQTDAGAAAFVLDWFAALNTAYRGSGTQWLDEASADDCTACADYLARLDAATDGGVRATSDPFVVSGARSDGARAGVAVVTFDYRVDAVTLVGPTAGTTGADVSVSPESTTRVRAVAVWSDGRWLMGEVGL